MSWFVQNNNAQTTPIPRFAREQALRVKRNVSKSRVSMKKNIVPKEVKVLANDLVWAQYTLDQYQIIYNSNKHIKELLIRETNQFFTQLYKMYWDSFSITIARLTDKNVNGKNKCLSIYSLLPLVKIYGIDENIVSVLVNKIETKAKGFKTKRNKFIAHRDFKLALKDDDLDLKMIYLTDIQEIYEYMGEILNIFFETIENSTWSWKAGTTDDAESLLLIMRDGIIYRELQARRNNCLEDYKEEQESSMKDMLDN